MNASLLDIIDRFAGLRVLVIGDAMLDSYLDGFTNRLSREAPVPVVTITGREDAPGGAANTAVNLRALRGEVLFLSVIGRDADGELLRRALEGEGVRTDCLLEHPLRRTISKRRVAASGQMIVRFDDGSTDAIDEATEQALIELLAAGWGESDAVIISDYGYGILTSRVRQAILELQGRNPHVIVADAKDLAAYRDLALTAVKPNYGEAVQLLGLARLEGACARADQIAPYADQLLAITGAQIVAVTLDSEGALVCEQGSLPYRTYAQPMPDSRAAGAGDTFVSALTLALLAGTATPQAAEIASAAASIVVARPGTTTCTASELHEHFLGSDKYFSDPLRLAERLEIERRHCRRIVFTNGCFDILHRGHIAYLNQAKSQGDLLVLGVNTDEGVQRLKGPSRPINRLEDRVQVLAALSSVDFVVPFNEDTPAELIRFVQPDIFVKGGDYTRDRLPEAAVVEELGGVVRILPYIDDHSTTLMIERIREVYAGEGVEVA